jgi:hypothetical protein
MVAEKISKTILEKTTITSHPCQLTTCFESFIPACLDTKASQHHLRAVNLDRSKGFLGDQSINKVCSI